MKKTMNIRLFLLIGLILVSRSIAQQTFVQQHGLLKVVGTHIVDKDGAPLALHGMSMYSWNNLGLQFYNASAVGHLVNDWKCTVLRIPILPGSVSSQTTPLKNVVDACIANGIYAIIDWHSMGGADATACSNFMKSMATSYGNTPNVMYETWNEPVSETWSTIKAYHQTVIAAIRTIDPDNIIICGDPQWDQHPEQAAASPITTSTNIAYSFHFYAATHKFASMGLNVATALKNGIALFVTEYGSCEASGSGTFDSSETRKWWNFLDSNSIGSTNWAVETNGETASAFASNASSTGPWTNANLTAPGIFVMNYIRSKYQAVRVVRDGFKSYRRDMGRGTNVAFSAFKGTSELFALNGARYTGVKPASGCYFARVQGTNITAGTNSIR
jgi:endoglucanase